MDTRELITKTRDLFVEKPEMFGKGEYWLDWRGDIAQKPGRVEQCCIMGGIAYVSGLQYMSSESDSWLDSVDHARDALDILNSVANQLRGEDEDSDITDLNDDPGTDVKVIVQVLDLAIARLDAR